MGKEYDVILTNWEIQKSEKRLSLEEPRNGSSYLRIDEPHNFDGSLDNGDRNNLEWRWNNFEEAFNATSKKGVELQEAKKSKT